MQCNIEKIQVRFYVIKLQRRSLRERKSDEIGENPLRRLKKQRIMICRRKSQQILVLKTNKKYQWIIETLTNMYLTLMLYN